MLASAGRSRSGDRFYNPPAVRRQLQLQLQQQQQQEQQQVLSDKQKLDKDKQVHNEQQSSHRPARIQRTRSSAESDDCASSTSATATPPASMSSHSPSRSGSCLSNLTNLDRFLESTTPLVPGQRFSKTSMAELRTQEDEFQPYFVLGDLWESFKEWSTFGAGVPLILNGSDSVVQYYVPYLSAIQLYIDPNMHKSRTRKPGLESDTNSSRGSSNGSSDYERERGFQPQQDLVEASRQGIKGLSISNKILNGSSSYEGESVSSQGVLAFEFLEYDPPFCREPLADKVSFLASQFPQLMTYRSCDLSPASWVSVAWYPIYRIPIGPTLQNLDSCFLTFHYLTKPDCAAAQSERQCLHGSSHPREARCGFDMASKLSLPIFGLASYKFKTAVWDQTGADASVKASSLWQAADDWLQSLNVKHPDYRFFESHNSYPR